MYSVSEEFLSQIKADNREFSVALTFNSTTELTGTTIQNISVDEIVNSADVLTLGCACSHKITINLIDAPKNIDYKNSFFTARMGLKLSEVPTRYEEVPLGKVYVTDVQTANDFKNVTITAYDGFCKMTGLYNAKVTAKTTLQAVYDDLRKQLLDECGIVLKAAILPDYSIENFPYIEGITYQQAIGYVAGCLGGFARFDRNGELEIATYTDTNFTVHHEDQYMKGFKKLTETPISITSVSTGTSENIIVRGDGSSGVAINFENPYITETMADAVYAYFNNFTYTPCQIRWRGNPAIQAGDIVHVIDSNGESHNVLVMNQTIKIGGGLQQTFDCKGKSENISKFSSSFESTSQKIDRVYKTLEEQILKATEAITGNDGGYVVFNTDDVTGHINEILIMDAPQKADAENVWRWNKEGFGHSSQGYNGPFTTAITADGKINASFILAGQMSTDYLTIGNKNFGDYISVDNGVMIFGDKDSEYTLRLGNIEVDGEQKQQVSIFWGDKRTAIFTHNGVEFDNLIGGKIRFQNFGFIPRQPKDGETSGNLTFTILN